MKLKTKMVYDYDNDTVKFEVDDGRGKPVSIDLFQLVEEKYGSKNARAAVNKILENKQEH